MKKTKSRVPKPKVSRAVLDAVTSRRVVDREMMDAFSNMLARTGFGTSNLLEGTTYPLTRLSRNYILMQSLYRSNWIARKLVDCIAEDMVKNWLQIVSDIPPDDIEDFDQTIDRTGTKEKLLTAIQWARLFGGAGAVIMLKGEGNRLDQPLVAEDVEPGSYRGLLTFDRWSGITPSANLNTDLDNPADYGLPSSYRVTTQTGKSFTVHSSRVLRFTGRSLPQWEFQAEQYWGISEYEVVYDELKKRDNTSWNIASLIFRANIIAMKQKNLSEALSGLGKSAAALQQFHATLTAQTQLMSNQGIMVLPEEGGLETHQYGFAGINDVYVSFMLDICGACEIPMSRLFGRTVSGLGQTGEGDEHIYYDLIGQKQKRELNPQLQKLFPVIAMSEWGEIPDDFDWQFAPVRSLTNEEQAELAGKKTTAIVETYNAGILDRQTCLKELRAVSEETSMYSNITDEMIEKADDEPIDMGEMEAGAGGSLKDLPGKEEKGLEVDEAGKRKNKKDAKDASFAVVSLPGGVELPGQGKKHCAYCDTDHSDDAAFCQKCGAALTVQKLAWQKDASVELLSKEEVHFEHPALGPNECSTCTHYDLGQKRCTIVAGAVAPEDWCEEYFARTKPNGKDHHAAEALTQLN